MSSIKQSGYLLLSALALGLSLHAAAAVYTCTLTNTVIGTGSLKVCFLEHTASQAVRDTDNGFFGKNGRISEMAAEISYGNSNSR